ncbi:phosphoribosylformylglycinamidine cyclo-ligase [Methanocorpusculum vombati]|uniref:Phosphoribosylformylglycinamidine cyclo-ligase n=1 Tax=Methanocorpusculum vombati TaxID=3002864 RepID=A0ABT4IJE3_9EURY|nr:phosphoribosylformylglycinamidine cyclo-ligase [Methanocorpusculum vombati]MCZ9318746.1 phosphoribosylformylglycinamidine cyclo-ligase [Methanocorpusculum sp.]MCZ0861860.1 phosphoribosylformylglycinamidine cyclo-ligase [Methanocorpusculum vombati]MDE2521170.1 phosphoribosylformylglycinamidine cyclo-ligase [Methanocorpusculum sp.]MDE2534907.1 phosphoribosylformylglycinamidine cyclo-ligase [Methanocorpusculum sp.]MDE2547726.1 phosphoribosylformylglycinamidine cyclo-ligase [Methanocorpusculum 
MSKKYSYKDAGVDINLEADGVKALIHQLSYKRSGEHGMLGGVGHFAGLIDFGSKVLSLCTDGVGTKMRVADDLGDWTTVGIDCIAMNVNDMYVMNIEPVAFVDYIATEGINTEQMIQIGVGLNEGAKLANMNIVGGETATLKGMINGLDLAGTCLGVQDRDRVVTGEKIAPGDVIIGVASTGVHSNGYTLARKVATENGGYAVKLPSGKTVGSALITPTRIYSEVLDVCRAVEVHGMCHVTGGGLLNFLRISEYGFSIDDPMPVPEILQWIKEKGELETNELYRTFNMGMGFAFIVPEASVAKILAIVDGAKVVGHVIPEHRVLLQGVEIN